MLRILIILLLFTSSAYGQNFDFNPITGELDVVADTSGFITEETDPTIGTLVSDRVCFSSDGATIDCNDDDFSFDGTNVGIGQANPGNKLVVDSSGADTNVQIDADVGQDSVLRFTGGGSTVVGHRLERNATDHDFYIYTYGVGDESLVIDYATGNVGIGTTNPSTILHAMGDATLGDNSSGDVTLTFDGDANTDGTFMWDVSEDDFEINGGVNFTTDVNNKTVLQFPSTLEASANTTYTVDMGGDGTGGGVSNFVFQADDQPADGTGGGHTLKFDVGSAGTAGSVTNQVQFVGGLPSAPIGEMAFEIQFGTPLTSPDLGFVLKDLNGTATQGRGFKLTNALTGGSGNDMLFNLADTGASYTFNEDQIDVNFLINADTNNTAGFEAPFFIDGTGDGCVGGGNVGASILCTITKYEWYLAGQVGIANTLTLENIFGTPNTEMATLGNNFIFYMDGGTNDNELSIDLETVAGEMRLHGTANSGTAVDTLRLDNIDLFVDPSQYVGIGSSVKEIVWNGNTRDVILNISHEPDELDIFQGQFAYSSTNGQSGLLGFFRSQGTEGSESAVDNADRLGGVNFYGWDGTDWELSAGIRVDVVDSTTVSDGVIESEMEFRTSNSSGATNTNMIIRSDGNVGIGSTTPGTLLEVSDSDTSYVNLIDVNNISTQGAGISYTGAFDDDWEAGNDNGAFKIRNTSDTDGTIGFRNSNDANVVAFDVTYGTADFIASGYIAPSAGAINNAILHLGGTVTKNADLKGMSGLLFNSTVNVDANQSNLLGASFDVLFWNALAYVIDSSLDNDGGVGGFLALPSITVDGADIGARTWEQNYGFSSSLITNDTGSGTTALTVNDSMSFIANSGTDIKAGTTLTNLYGAKFHNPTVGGTLTNQYGLYIHDLTSATNDYGIYVEGADTYALWVDSDITRFDGDVETYAGRIVETDRLTGNTTLDDTYHNVFCDTDGGAFTVTLPAAPDDGRYYRIINTGSSGNDLTIDENGNPLLGSTSTMTVSDGDVVIIVYESSEGWW